jgi:hypothetical protein
MYKSSWFAFPYSFLIFTIFAKGHWFFIIVQASMNWVDENPSDLFVGTNFFIYISTILISEVLESYLVYHSL